MNIGGVVAKLVNLVLQRLFTCRPCRLELPAKPSLCNTTTLDYISGHDK